MLKYLSLKYMRACSSGGERLLDTQEARGSKPRRRTKKALPLISGRAF